MLPGKGLEIVIPHGFDKRKLPEIIEGKKDWIAQAHRRLVENSPKGEAPDALPESIHLKALDKSFSVRYTVSRARLLKRVESDESFLEVTQRGNDREECRDLLLKWLKGEARKHLVPWLRKVSAEVGLDFDRVQIRGQRGRWGSCSSRATISLNYKLLFLPPELVRYVFIHELCHTAQMNHSPRFWSLVARFEPRYKALDAEMNNAWRCLPVWTR